MLLITTSRSGAHRCAGGTSERCRVRSPGGQAGAAGPSRTGRSRPVSGGHSGPWRRFDKEARARMCGRCSNRSPMRALPGSASITGWRPTLNFRRQSEDLNSAIRWVKAKAANLSRGYVEDRDHWRVRWRLASQLCWNSRNAGRRRVAAVVDFYGPVDYGKLAQQRREHPERFNMASINRHAANGGGFTSLEFNSWMKPVSRSLRSLAADHCST